MRFLPVFLDLKAGPVLLIGAGELLRAKLRVLAAAGARIRVHAIDGNQDLGLSAEDAARIDIAAGDPLTADLSGVIAIVCAGAGDVGIAMSVRAKALGLPVNVMDDLEHSSFIFPAIVDRGDVVVAVGTGGTSPVVARRVRERIEALLPARIGELAEFIGGFRKTINGRIAEFPLRRRFWERVIDGPIGAAVLAGRKGEADAALKAISDPSAFARADKPEGSVALVGAGPGDPDLLTIKALRALQDADIVFHDELVSPEILDRIRRDTTRVPVGRRIGKPGIGQDAINQRMIEAARSGQRVVRLKGGDPLVFGRGGEEIEALVRAGVAVEVVPGITAALGCAASAAIPLTHRDHAQACIFVTGQLKDGTVALDWPMLARPRQTVVVYMGAETLPIIAARLIEHGLPSSTPVALIDNGTTTQERRVVGTLATIEQQARRAELDGPTLCMIGEVIGLTLARESEFRFVSRIGL